MHAPEASDELHALLTLHALDALRTPRHCALHAADALEKTEENENQEKSGEVMSEIVNEAFAEASNSHMSMSRRSFVAAAGAVAGVAAAATGAMAASGRALAAESGSASASASASTDESASAAQASSYEVSDTYDFDVVVVGGSAAGLAATASAAEEGASVVCIEKLGSAMGAGTYYGFINTELLQENGVETVDEDEYAKKIFEASEGQATPALIRTFVRHSAVVGDWMDNLAVATGNQALFSSSMGSENTAYYDDEASGSSAFGALTSYGEQNGATYVYSTEVVSLEAEDGRVTGVIAHDLGTDTYARYNAANGVVLATGGYTANTDLIATYIPWVDTDKVLVFNPIGLSAEPTENGNMGDGLTMAQAVGALVPAAPHTPMIHYISGAMPVAGSLSVNGQGKRFIDEGASMEVAAQTVMRQPGHTWFQIADAKPSGMALLMQQMAAGSGTESSEAAPSGEGDASAQAGPMASLPSSDAPTYDTLEELAEANGFDPEVLQATVDRWNELVAQGVDEDFGSDFTLAVSIDTAPFTCTESPNCLLAAIGGAQIDENMQVLDTSYEPIPGLYAAGNCTCGFYGPNYPMQVQAGIARAFCTVSGYLASKNALGVEA
jgi:fumarate reductase flavoprotein subunit